LKPPKGQGDSWVGRNGKRKRGENFAKIWGTGGERDGNRTIEGVIDVRNGGVSQGRRILLRERCGWEISSVWAILTNTNQHRGMEESCQKALGAGDVYVSKRGGSSCKGTSSVSSFLVG